MVFNACWFSLFEKSFLENCFKLQEIAEKYIALTIVLETSDDIERAGPSNVDRDQNLSFSSCSEINSFDETDEEDGEENARPG